MENASEYEAPRMSIQTKDLIRYNNHITYYKKNHSDFIQKSHYNSTNRQQNLSIYFVRQPEIFSLFKMCSGTGGAMDAAVLDMKRCADLFLFSTTFSSHSLTPIRSQGTPTFPPCRPAQRRRPQTPTVKPQANSASPTNRPAQR